MIVSMKKLSIIVQSKDIDATLKALARSGVVHVEHQRPPENENISLLKEKYLSLFKAIDALPDPPGFQKTHSHPDKLMQEILNFVDKEEVLTEGIKNIKKAIEKWKDWGDFDPELIYKLEAKGVWVRLCKLTKKELRNIPEGIIIKELFNKGNIFYCAAISREEIKLPFEVIQLPEQGLEEMLASLKREEEKLREIENGLAVLSKYKKSLFSYGKKLSSLIEFNKVSAGLGSFEKLSYLIGYSPRDKVKSIEKIAERESWGLIVEDPLESDNVPTLIRNPRWIEMIRPLFKMINTIPGYREVDISLWFLVFFSIFFGMLIGDAGYGAIFFVLNLFCHVKFRNKVKDRSIFFLTYLLSLCAITWGLLTGTFFGQAWLPERVHPLLPLLRQEETIQALCFLIGAIHLSIAHLWKFIRKMPSIKAFSEAGWICMLWAAYFIAKTLILGEAFAESAKWLLIIGASLIILCTNPSKSLFKTVGSGIGGLLLNVINSFTDIVSYIRLFAVGAATVAVADAFNQMASGIGYGNIFAGFLTAFVLLFGHTLNILLGAMAILVHGVRLNMLEFSSHMNMEWSGVEYTPFQMKTQLTEAESRGKL
ncbi:MAG: hypothetical protein P9L93_00160 [Candidatus Gorgyraea atricola]|nr:hypothetical protein [Candidatus Gorgyraea atricola]